MTTLPVVLEKIQQVESTLNGVHRIYISVRREVERDQKLGRFVHPIRHLEIEGLDGRLTDISNQLQELYDERNHLQVVEVAERMMARRNGRTSMTAMSFLGPEKLFRAKGNQKSGQKRGQWAA